MVYDVSPDEAVLDSDGEADEVANDDGVGLMTLAQVHADVSALQRGVSAARAVKVARAVAAYVRASGQRRARLAHLAATRSCPIGLDAAHRWTSTHRLLAELDRHRCAVTQVLLDDGLADAEALPWRQWQHIRRLLQPFHAWTEVLEQQATPTVSLLPVAVYDIHATLRATIDAIDSSPQQQQQEQQHQDEAEQQQAQQSVDDEGALQSAKDLATALLHHLREYFGDLIGMSQASPVDTAPTDRSAASSPVPSPQQSPRRTGSPLPAIEWLQAIIKAQAMMQSGDEDGAREEARRLLAALPPGLDAQQSESMCQQLRALVPHDSPVDATPVPLSERDAAFVQRMRMLCGWVVPMLLDPRVSAADCVAVSNASVAELELALAAELLRISSNAPPDDRAMLHLRDHQDSSSTYKGFVVEAKKFLALRPPAARGSSLTALASQSALCAVHEMVAVNELVDPLTWWRETQRDHYGVKDVMPLLARQVLAAPMSSAEVERVFSISGHIINARRTALGAHVVDQLMYLRMTSGGNGHLWQEAFDGAVDVLAARSAGNDVQGEN